MPTTYPGTIQSITDYAGTVTLAAADHAGWHATTSDTVEALEAVIGTTAGTSVLKNMSTGDFAAVQGTLHFGTNKVALGTTPPSLHNSLVATAAGSAGWDYIPPSSNSYTVYKSGSTYYAVTGNASYANSSNADLSTLVTTLMASLSSGGEIYLSLYGNHNWTTEVSPTNNITVRGINSRTTTLYVTANKWAFRNTDGDTLSNFRIFDLNFSIRGTADNGGGIVQLYNTTNFVMQRCEASTDTYTGPNNLFYLYKSSQIFINNNYIHDNGGTGVYLQGCKYYHITNNRFYANLDNVIDCAPYTGVTGNGFGYIGGNITWGTAGSIYIWGQSLVDIANNILLSPRSSGIFVGNNSSTIGDDATDVNVMGNVIKNWAAVANGAAITMSGAAGTTQSLLKRVNITNNLLSNDATAVGTTQDGIQVVNGERGFIFGNSIQAPVSLNRDAIYLYTDGATPQTSCGQAQYNYLIGGTVNNFSGGTTWITTTNFLV